MEPCEEDFDEPCQYAGRAHAYLDDCMPCCCAPCVEALEEHGLNAWPGALPDDPAPG